MKKYIFTILMAVAAILSVSAQQKLVVKLDNGTTQEFETWEVDSLYFTPSATISSTAPAETEIVDLGFAKWAPYNLGSTKASETGWLVGWGDVTGTNKSTKLKYFPAQNYSNDIYETAYDIVHTMWGGDWRLPVAEDIQLLRDSCTWEYASEDAVLGWKLTSKKEGYTNVSIFLPFTGYRNGKNAPADVDNLGLYWTGNIGENTGKAKALLINETDKEMVERNRFLGLAIRPIYGKFVHQLALTAEISKIAINEVSFTADIVGDLSAVSKIGICYGEAGVTLNPEDPNAANKTEWDLSDEEHKVSGLQPNTSYKAVLYLRLKDETIILGKPEVIEFTTLAKFPVPATAVDLGLSVEWAPWNLGESDEWGHTQLYGWGDVEGENHSTNHNTYAIGLNTNTTSICGDIRYDIAAKQWGNGWRLPTLAEIRELYSSSIKVEQEITDEGYLGIRYTNKTTGASILIPACGTRYGDNLMLPSSYYYWTGEASYNSVDGWRVRVARPLLNTVDEQQYPKFWGMGIRPVKSKSGGNNSSNPHDSYAVDLGLSDGTFWSDRNLGASSATDYGGYYAWAETSPRTTNFDKENYLYYDSTTGSFQKTGTDANSLNGEWQICGDENYDAATNQWKGKWRMPTDDQILCLINECSWQWKTNYNGSGHNGYLVTGPNGRSIFLPAAGVINGSELSQDGEQAYYWSGALNTQQTSFERAYVINFERSDNPNYIPVRQFTTRVSGRSIRPVMKP